jgi:ABC-2 type transport system permease protein
MLGALLYLRVTSLKNQLLSRLKRLRNPKYLAGAIAGLVYMYFFFFRHLFATSGSGQGRKRAAAGAVQVLPTDFTGTLPLVLGLGALLVLAIILLAWVLPSDRPGLRFSEAETAFLFPAPLSRRALINFKLLSSQFSILFTSLFFSLISNRWTFLGGNALTHALGWWVVLSTINLHFTGAALTISRLVENGVSPLRRRLYVLAGIGVVIAATLAWVWHTITSPRAEDLAGFVPFMHYLLGILDHGVLGAVLLPFKFVLGPFLAPTTRDFLIALPPALLVIVGHYSWVLRMETSFEEASLALAEKRTATITAMREGKRFDVVRTKGRAAPFHLADTGRPELAFLWKNLLSTASYFNLRVLGIAAAVIIVGSRWFLGGDNIAQVVRDVVSGFSLVAGGYILLFGPHMARQDLRGDMANADILKIYPLRGWQVLGGQMLAPVAILTGIVWLCVLAAALAFKPSAGMAHTFTLGVRISLALGIAAVTPLLCALQLLVLNGATVVFPAWFQTTRVQGTGGGGIELMGQRLIFVFGQFFVVLVAMLPAALSAGLLVFVAQWLIGAATAIALATLVVLVVLAAEVWCGLWWLGERFERLDVSAELRP